MGDFLRESPFYQDIFNEGYAKGYAEGWNKGYAEGLEVRREVLYKLLQIVVENHFPSLLPSAKSLRLPTDDPTIFYELIRKLIRAKDEQEAREHLLQADRHGDKQS